MASIQNDLIYIFCVFYNMNMFFAAAQIYSLPALRRFWRKFVIKCEIPKREILWCVGLASQHCHRVQKRNQGIRIDNYQPITLLYIISDSLNGVFWWDYGITSCKSYTKCNIVLFSVDPAFITKLVKVYIATRLWALCKLRHKTNVIYLDLIYVNNFSKAVLSSKVACFGDGKFSKWLW